MRGERKLVSGLILGSITVLVFAGCVRVVDRLPIGAPKGYVEFYTDAKCPVGLHIIHLNERKKEEYVGYLVFGFGAIRIACKPGPNAFCVVYGRMSNRWFNQKWLTIDVQEGKIIRVLTTVDNLKVTRFFDAVRYEFWPLVEPEEPIAIPP